MSFFIRTRYKNMYVNSPKNLKKPLNEANITISKTFKI